MRQLQAIICRSEQAMASCSWHSCTVPCIPNLGCRFTFKRGFRVAQTFQ